VTEETTVALHEAAHAVVAARLGYRVERVRLRPGGRGGEVVLAARELPETRPVQEGRIMLRLAGACAQATLAPSPRGSLVGAGQDLTEATALAMAVAGRQRALPLVHLLLRQTEALLRAEASTVRGLQQALLRERTLEGAVLQGLLKRLPSP
jgi:hypothetical protein